MRSRRDSLSDEAVLMSCLCRLCLYRDTEPLVFICVHVCVCRALRVRKKMGGENMPVQMIGDILSAELSHMQPYIRFCSCQINGATMLQTRIDSEPNFKDFLKVGRKGK